MRAMLDEGVTGRGANRPADGTDEPTPPTASPLRIAFLSYRSDPNVGGQGVFVSNVARALAARGHAVTILSGPPYPRVPPGVTMRPVPSLDLFAQPNLGRKALRWRHLRSITDTAEYLGHVTGKFMEPWSFGRRAAAHIRRHAADYDVVLDNQCLARGLLAIARRLPVVGVVHHPIRRDLETMLASEAHWGRRLLARRWYGFLPMQERVARRLPRLVTVSAASARDIFACMGVDPARVAVVPLGVDTAVFRPGIAGRSALRLVTTSSSHLPLKGLRFLIEAHARLRVEFPTLELCIVGKPRPGPIEDLIAGLGTGDAIRFVHGLSDAGVAEVYAGATVCVVPSLYEGFGLPVIEAMACGTPVVATTGGALPEVVGDAGVVVRAGDAGAIVEAVRGLLRDPAARARLSAAGLARVRARYGWDRVGAAYEAMLRSAVAARC